MESFDLGSFFLGVGVLLLQVVETIVLLRGLVLRRLVTTGSSAPAPKPLDLGSRVRVAEGLRLLWGLGSP